jgi:outer membrane protein TolC
MKKILIILLMPFVLQAAEIKNIGELFDSLKTHPVVETDQLRIEQATTGKQMVYSKLYPNIDIFGRYDYANIPTGMLPVPPNELLDMVKKPAVAQPFSERIYRLGATISMPVFVSSIFSTAAKARAMQRSAESMAYINLLKNEAIIVSANSNLIFINSLDDALNKKRESISKTKELIEMKTNNGRAPGEALILINNALHQIDISKNDLDIQKQEVLTMIQNLTGVRLTDPIPMQATGSYKAGTIKALEPLQQKLEGDKMALRAEIEKLFPSFFLMGSYSNNLGYAYNNDKFVNNDYYTISLVLKVPIFAMDQYQQISLSQVEVAQTENDLKKQGLELQSQIDQLQKNLELIDNSIQLYETSIKEKEELLNIAKTSYELDRMTIEDYLKYEDDLFFEKSKLFKAQAEKWQTTVKLAVIFGNKIEDIVR